MLLDGGASVYLDSLPRETFMPSDSGLLAGEDLALVEADRRWVLRIGALYVSISDLFIGWYFYAFHFL